MSIRPFEKRLARPSRDEDPWFAAALAKAHPKKAQGMPSRRYNAACVEQLFWRVLPQLR
jgi:hypothetical protein